ncbi:MFS transporter [Undibacterium arcticum]
MINGGYTSMVAWLPAFYMQRGMTNQQSGSLLGLMTAMQVAAAVLLPTLARRGVDRRPWLAFGLLAQLIGFMGLIAGSEQLAVLSVSVLGFGLGGTFSLCLILALDHLQNPRSAGELTAFMQGIGFIIAALAPFLTGWIRDMTGSFFLFAWQMLACTVFVLLGVTAF